MKTFIISPPFGSFIVHEKCTSVLGTYTLHQRGGWMKKLYRVALTVRPIYGGWINNIGLQNPGIRSVRNFDPMKIYSIAAIEPQEWDEIIKYIPNRTTVELNISCPNVGQKPDIHDHQIRIYLDKFPIVIFKLSPTDSIYTQIDRLAALGVKYIHIANTLPTPKGGESGGRLKSFSLKTIADTKKEYPNLKIIGGGGIYSAQDVETYKRAGADYFSLATVWFKPWQALRLLGNF